MRHKELQKQIVELKEDIENRVKKNNLPDLIDCQICGCCVRRSVAIKGKSEIRIHTVFSPYNQAICWPHSQEEEYIFTPFYCKRCSPVEEQA